MANKKINQLDSRAGASLSDLSLVGDPINGVSYKLTLTQISTLMGVPGKFNQPTGTTSQYLRGDGSLATFPFVGNGTVTSVNLTAGTGISVSGGPITTTGSINVVNTAPDQVVGLTGAGTTTISGTYPNFTISSADLNIGTVTSVDMSVPTGLTISGNPITSAGTLAVGLASGYSIPTTASQATWNTAYNDSIVSAGVTGTTTKTLTLTQQDAGTITASWTDINTDAVTSVFGRTGAVVATGGDYTTTQVTEGTNLYYTEGRVSANTDVAANTAARHNAVALGTANGLSLSGQVLSLGLASTSTNGALSSTDWNTFNGKQASGNYITALTGEVTASGPGSASATLLNSAVIGKLLTGLNLVGGGTIAATDTILQAFGKTQNQISALVGGVMYEGVWNASTNSPAIVSSVGSKGDYYVVNVAGSTNIDGITDWKVGDWIIFNGTTWDKVDNTDAVSSVNGFTGAVSLTTANISEVTNLYYTEGRVSANTDVAANTASRHNAVTLGTANGLSLSGQVLSLALASGSTTGALSSTDWTTFNNKQNTITNPVTGTGTTNYLPKWTSSSALGNSLVYDNGTNVLINTTSDSGQKLQVNGTIKADGRIFINAGNGNQLYLNNAGERYTQITFDNNSTSISQAYLAWDSVANFFEMYAKTGGGLKFYANQSEAMIITTSSFVGIGTSTPSYKLDVNRSSLGTIAQFITLDGTYNPRLLISGTAEGIQLFATYSSGGAEALMFGTANSEKMRLTSNLLIGSTVDSGERLQVTGSAKITGDVNISGVFRETLTTNRQTASYTLALADNGKLVEMNVATANNLTVPLNSSVTFPIGTKIDLAQYGAGQTTIVATSGVTVRSAGGALKLAVQYSGGSLIKIGTDEWYLFGDITV